MRCRVIRGGWTWLGVERHVGDLLDVPADPPTWLANRARDGLVEPIAEEAPAAPSPKPKKVKEPANG